MRHEGLLDLFDLPDHSYLNTLFTPISIRLKNAASLSTSGGGSSPGLMGLNWAETIFGGAERVIIKLHNKKSVAAKF